MKFFICLLATALTLAFLPESVNAQEPPPGVHRQGGRFGGGQQGRPTTPPQQEGQRDPRAQGRDSGQGRIPGRGEGQQARGQFGGPQGRQGGPPMGDEMDRPKFPIIEALDANGDGQLTREEIRNATQALMTLDKNRDGILDQEEMLPPRPNFGSRNQGREQSRPGTRSGQGRESQERSGRGRSGQGFQGHPPQGRPGYQGRQGQGSQQRGQGRPSQGRPGQGGNEARDYQQGNSQAVDQFMQSDRNGDGKVQRNELPRQLQNVINDADTDNDGALSRGEVQAYYAERNSNAGQRGRDTRDQRQQGRGRESESRGRSSRPQQGRDQSRELSGSPLRARIVNDMLLLTGPAEDIALIKEAFEEAQQQLKSK